MNLKQKVAAYRATSQFDFKEKIRNFGANKFLHLTELITSGTRYNDGHHKEFKSTESSNMNVWPKLDILQDKSNYQASY